MPLLLVIVRRSRAEPAPLMMQEALLPLGMEAGAGPQVCVCGLMRAVGATAVCVVV